MKQSPYMNSDGTFKNGFEGCVLHMTTIEGHAPASAKAICGKIAQETLHNRAGVAVLSGDFKHPADNWYQIEVPGEHLNKDANVVQVIDAPAVNGIVNRFNSEADDYEARNGAYPGMLIDIEHFKHDAGKESRAYGWLMRLENREGKPFGQIRWTRTGKEAIDGGDYRFFSTEYNPADLQILNAKDKTPRVRPLRLAGLSLTNVPNNQGGAPITNQSRHDAGALPADSKTPKTKNKMQRLLTELGLSADASEEAAIAELAKIKNRALEGDKLKNQITELETQHNTLLEAQADADLAPLMDKMSADEIKPLREQLIKNRAAMLPGVKLLVAKLIVPKGGKTPITNRAEAKTPGKETPEQEITPSKLRTEVQKICNRDGLTGPKAFELGYNRLQDERPELFAAQN